VAEKKVSIVLADDHPFILFALKQLVAAEADLELVGEAATGLEALSLIRSVTPDVAVIDVGMPGMTGVDVCRKLKGGDALDRTPVFLLTAHGQESDEQAGHAAGADRFFTKPFSPKEILREVRNALGDA